MKKVLDFAKNNFSFASAMKQVPTNATMHSLSSLSKADLSIYDSVDDQVLSDYAVSKVRIRPKSIFSRNST